MSRIPETVMGLFAISADTIYGISGLTEQISNTGVVRVERSGG